MNKEVKRKKNRRMNNKILCKRYPFLKIYNLRTGKKIKPYNYDITWLDDFEHGWCKAFGYQMLEEIRDDLIKCNYLNDFRIIQIKEKFGSLRFYIGSVPTSSKIFQIINKYEELSRHTCMWCGAPAKTYDKNGWFITLCDNCKEKLN